MTSPLGEAALHYHSQGLRIFPLVPNQKAPYLTGTQGYKLCNKAKHEGLTEPEVRSFWTDNEKANIGMPLAIPINPRTVADRVNSYTYQDRATICLFIAPI